LKNSNRKSSYKKNQYGLSLAIIRFINKTVKPFKNENNHYKTCLKNIVIDNLTKILVNCNDVFFIISLKKWKF
jgi:hypothetical protein